MSNSNLAMREMMVKDYLLKIDFNKNWSYNHLREGLKSILGEEPAVDIIYKKDVMINEVSGKADEIRKIDKVVVVFSDMDKLFKKVEILID